MKARYSMCDHDHPWTFQNEKHKTDIENSYQGNPGFKISNADISFDLKTTKSLLSLILLLELEYGHHIHVPIFIKD